MLKILLKLIKPSKGILINKSNSNRYYIKNLLAMAGEGVKNKSDLNLEHLPVKKIKIDCDDEINVVQKRTVATMCGAWRPDEVDGGLIFVFKKREPCLSPDPTQESDYPENIEDFWEASFMSIDDIQIYLAPEGRIVTGPESPAIPLPVPPGMIPYPEMGPGPTPTKCAWCNNCVLSVVRVEYSDSKMYDGGCQRLGMRCDLGSCLQSPIGCQNVEHYCPNCNAYFGTYSKPSKDTENSKKMIKKIKSAAKKIF